MILPKKKEDMTREEMHELTENKMASMEADIHLYTDGSTSGKQENGGAGVYIQNARTGEVVNEGYYAAGKWCSSYACKSIAMREAIHWIRQNENRERTVNKYLIITDSKSLLDAIDSNN